MIGKIAELPGWGDISARKLAGSVRLVASGGVSLSRFIYSLGIPMVGTHASRLVAERYGNAQAFLNALDDASKFDYASLELLESEDDKEGGNETAVILPFAALTGEDGSEKVKGIGPAALSSLHAFSREEALMGAARDLETALLVRDDASFAESETASVSGASLDGMTVVFTGSIPGLSRGEAKSAAMQMGAKSTPNTVSKSTSLVVEGEKGGKKVEQARNLGVRVMKAEDFLMMVDGKDGQPT